jgi:hypothetical protein
MDLAKNNAPKGSKIKKKQGKKENIILLSVFIIFIAIAASLYYFFNVKSYDGDTVALINREKITTEELDWWYRLTVNAEDRDFITKHDFLVWSLIPQELLVQEAEKQGIQVSDDEVETLLGKYIIENAMTLEEFEDYLLSRGFTIEDIRKSFETRAAIMGLLKKEGIILAYDGSSYPEEENKEFWVYLDKIVNQSDITIFNETIEKLVLKSFEITGDDICDEGKPVIRLYTTSWCEICNESSEVFENSVKELAGKGKIKAYHWSLDTGDDLLTVKKEAGVPQEEVEIFKKYSPSSSVPTVVLGCKYKRVGKFGIPEQDEFVTILKTLAGE